MGFWYSDKKSGQNVYRCEVCGKPFRWDENSWSLHKKIGRYAEEILTFCSDPCKEKHKAK